jgi:hypothetical protein
MGSGKLNQWLTLVANIGVIAGLVLVAYEINQTRADLEISASADITDNFTSSVYALAHDPELSELMYRAEHSYEELDDIELWRIHKYFDGFFTMAQQDFFVILEIAEENLIPYSFDWRERMAMPVYRDYWERRESRYHPDFRAFLDRIISESDSA